MKHLYERCSQNLEQSISSARASLTTLKLTRQGAQAELADLIRSRTELQCIVADLQAASERDGGRREELEHELAMVQNQIIEKEAALERLKPEWDSHRANEGEEKRALGEVQTQLDALFAKRGRLNRFRSRADRDGYLREEIASLQAYRTSQSTALQQARTELETIKALAAEVDGKIEGAEERTEGVRSRIKELGEQIAQLKDDHAEKSERRKELWREETKLKSLVDTENEERKTAERHLEGMMDKVCYPL